MAEPDDLVLTAAAALCCAASDCHQAGTPQEGRCPTCRTLAASILTLAKAANKEPL